MFMSNLSKIGMFIILDWKDAMEETTAPRLERVFQFP